MKFPSLLFKNKYAEPTVSREAVKDLKLDLLVPDDVLFVFTMPCTKEDILYRQKLFDALYDEKSRMHLSELKRIISKVQKISNKFEEACCDNERNVIYAALISALSDFYSAAAKEAFCDFGFYDEFRKAFAEYSENPEIKTIFDKAKVCHKKLSSVMKNTWSYTDEKFRISKSTSESYAEKLKVAAFSMGIDANLDFSDADEPMPQELIDALAKLYPEEFGVAEEFYEFADGFYDPDILKYYAETEFYLSMTDVFKLISDAGIPLCTPEICGKKEIRIKDAYDVTLLYKNCKEIIPNDVEFSFEEPFYFLTGANGGGKTTYLRAVGTSVLFFLTGCKIPARSASLYEISGMFTHFPKDERFDALGRFDDEKLRIDDIKSKADINSFVLLNETYSTTSEEDAVKLTQDLASYFNEKNIFGIYVTHQQGMEDIGIPYLNVMIDADDENRRTYKITKRTENKGSFANDVLKKYGLTEDMLSKRFGVYDTGK